MRKTFPSQLLADLTTSGEDSKTKTRPSRRKRAIKAKLPPSVFDRVASALQPALDEIDLAWA